MEKEPLASPGTVVKVSRGSAAEQLAALPMDEMALPPSKANKAKPAPAKPTRRQAKPKPRPSRAAFEAADKAVEIAMERQAKALAEIVRRETELASQRRRLIETQNAEMKDLTVKRDERKRLYDEAIKVWRG